MRELPPAARLGAFGVLLGGVFVAALWVGSATADLRPEPPAATAPHAEGEGHAPADREAEVSVEGTVGDGTSLSAGGLRLDVPVTTLPPSLSTPFAFRVLGEDGPVTAFDAEQGGRMHLVIVSRDLSRHAHVQPEMAADGTWNHPLTLSPGSYRAVADFSTGGERRRLAVDLVAPGPLEVTPLPAPATSTTVGDLRVELSRDGDQLSFTAYRGDTAVVPEPYLGAQGHLVAFRAGDLAYAHLQQSGVQGATTSYDAALPGPGSYRLFLELQVDGTVRTATFTLEVAP